jgi:hypothetical protein
MAEEIAAPETPETPETPFPKADPKLNPRNQAFAEIAARANERQTERSAEPMPPRDSDPAPTDANTEGEELTLEEGAAQANAAAAASEAAETPAALEAPAATAAPAAKGIDPNADYDVTVDGQPIKVKGAKLIDAGFRTFQKETAADYRLQLATQMLEQAKKTVSGVPAAQGTPPAEGATQQQPQQAEQISDAQLAELIQYGTKEQAAEAIKLVRQRDSNAVTTQGLQQFMRDQLPQLLNVQIAARDAVQFANSEYSDLLTDPYLKEVFLTREEAQRRAGDHRHPMERYKEIGEGIRKHFNRPKSATPTTPAKTMEDRQAAKAKAPTAPRLASARMEGGAGTQRPKSREQIIDEMRKARGQHSLNRI